MPKSSPSPEQSRPGNKFFATIIAVGLVVLIAIWLFETKSGRNKSVPAIASSPKKTVRPPQTVLVMVKTNSPTSALSNAVSILTATTQTLSTITQTNWVRTNLEPNVLSDSEFVPRPVQSVFEAQLALARLGISAGSIDGTIGSQTRAALRAFQERERLPGTGELDDITKARLLLQAPAYTRFIVTTNELFRLQPLGTNWWSKAQQSALEYETILEMLAEKFWSSPGFLKLLNPSINWSNVTPGVSVRVPAVEKLKAQKEAAFVRVSLSAKNMKVFDAQTNLIAHFPCSIAQKVEKRPVGKLYVEKIAVNPDYTFDPSNFPESFETRTLKTRLILSPGPNNPVGTVWIGLNKPGYGIHGTPKPEEVGRTESHGCFRLANWNAEYLVRLVSAGTPIVVEP